MIIQSKKVWIADQFISAAVELEQGKITGIFPYGEKQADVDYGSKRIVPGFMDIHCHGAYEFDTNDAKPEGLRYCWVSVKQFSKNDTATACQDWLRSTRLGRGSIKSHVRTVKVLGMGLFAFQERVHLWKGVTH